MGVKPQETHEGRMQLLEDGVSEKVRIHRLGRRIHSFTEKTWLVSVFFAVSSLEVFDTILR